MRAASLTIAITLCCPSVTWAQAGAAWLDSRKPAAWNMPGAAIPTAPRVQGTVDPRCQNRARPAQLSEDKQVRDKGWELVGAFTGGWQVLVIRATSGYDGMCRFRQYQDFVFVRGVFAGTLSPAVMESRTDGAISRVTLQSDRRLTAEYLRYTPTDPLCCASRTTIVEFEITPGTAVVRPVSASTAPNMTAAASPPALAGTAWQLVRFQGSDDRTQAPDDRTKYTIEFAADGGLNVRFDCNRGRGNWTTTGPGQIQFGLMALTRAACPPGSLHDQLVRQWSNIRSYVFRNGHLFLVLMADGGTYEFEPWSKDERSVR